MNIKDHHPIHYMILLGGLLVASMLLFVFRFNSLAQNLLILFTGLFYCLWGLFHHHLEGRLTKIIALEYISFSLFVSILILTVLNL